MAADTCTSSASPPTSRVRPKTDEQQRLVGASRQQPAEGWPHRRATVRMAPTASRATATVATVVGRIGTGQEGGDDGQVHGHGQVFDHEQVEHRRRLAVADPVEVAKAAWR